MTLSNHHLFNQPTCVVERILLQPTLNILDRCAISQTCKTLHNFTSSIYSIFEFPLSPSNITSLSHKKSSAIKPQELKCVPVIVVRSGVYNVAIGSDGDDYSAIFFNKKGIVRVVKVRTKKDGVSIECLYSVLVQRMLFTCTKFKDRVLLIESPPGKDYFAHTYILREIIEKFGKTLYIKLNSDQTTTTTTTSSSSTSSSSQTNSVDSSTTTENSSSSTTSMTTSDGVNVDFMVWQNTKQTRDMLLKGIVGMIRRFRQRERENSKEFSTTSGGGEQRWYIKALMQFHYRYLMCQQKLYIYGNSLRKRHTEIMNFLTNEFKGSLLSTFSYDWSYNNESENELSSSNNMFSFALMDLTKSSSSPSSKKLSRSVSLSSSISSSSTNNEFYYREVEIEQQLAQLNERHLFLRTLMEKFKSVMLINQGLDSCCIVFRNLELQSIYEDLRINLTKILHKREKVSEVIEAIAVKLKLILKSLYDQDIRNKYSAMNKELAGQGINVQLDNNYLKKQTTTMTSSSPFTSYTYASPSMSTTLTKSPSSVYINTLTSSPQTTITSSTTSMTSTTSTAPMTKSIIPHQSDHDLSAESILDALLLQVPFEHIFSRKMFIKLLAQRNFETMCAEYGDHTARIDYDDYCSSSNEDLSDDGFFNNNSGGSRNSDDSDFFHHYHYNSSGRSFFYDIETGQHVSQDYARKFFINWFEQNCKKFCYKLVEIGDWLNAICYILFIAKHLLKDDCNWVEQYDESEGACTTEWRFEIVEKIETELISLTKNVVKSALLKKNCNIDENFDDNMIKIWKTWWLYACSEVLDNIETSNAKIVLEKMEDILEMKSSYTNNTSTCVKDKGKEKENV